MIIPVVSDDIIYFSKLQSKVNKKRYELSHVKSEEDIIDIILKCNYPICIIDINSKLIESLNLQDALKNRGCHSIDTIAYYPHVDIKLKEKAVDFGTNLQVTRNQLFKNLNNILDDIIFNQISES
jgi:DNA-binding NtrC family response regulator